MLNVFMVKASQSIEDAYRASKMLTDALK